MYRSDAEIETEVNRHLVLDTFVPHRRITTNVEHGVVTLSGTVDYTSHRLAAAIAIRDIPGVRCVLNEITVSEPEVAPHAIRAAILEALERHAAREMRDLQLDIVDGRVTLTGDVQSAAERRAIIGATTGAPGVDEVIDQLHVID